MRSQALRNFYNFSCKNSLRLVFCLPKHSEKEKKRQFSRNSGKRSAPLAHNQTQCFPWPGLLEASSLDTVPADLEPGLWLNPSKAETSRHY